MALEVEIFGQRYVVRSDAGEEHLRRVAQLVDASMREAASAHSSMSAREAAVLAALHLASELVRAEGEDVRIVAEVEARADALVRRIASLDPGRYAS